MKKFSKITIVFFTFSILWTGFMLWNASRTGEQSRAVSDSITDTIKNSIESNNKVPSIFEGTQAIYSQSPEKEENDSVSVNSYILKIFIRKSGHLLGYTLLAFLYAITFISHRIQVDISFIFSVSGGFLVACLDETIQSFTKGRSGSFSDVLIDTCGCIMGAFIAFTFLMLYIFIKSNFSKDKKDSTKEKVENDENCKKISETD